MGQDPELRGAGETSVRVRYWAAARAATGVGEETLVVVGTPTVEAVRAAAAARHPLAASALGVCSVLVGDRPLGAGDAAVTVVPDGQAVDFLPPFAGG